MLFPMEEVFEDFVTAAFRRNQQRFTVRAQGPMRYLATDGADKPAFWLKPDIVLMEHGQVRLILDAKWKRLDASARNYGVRQDDVYQLFAYGRTYGCRRVVLVYPRTAGFSRAGPVQVRQGIMIWRWIASRSTCAMRWGVSTQ